MRENDSGPEWRVSWRFILGVGVLYGLVEFAAPLAKQHSEPLVGHAVGALRHLITVGAAAVYARRSRRGWLAPTLVNVGSAYVVGGTLAAVLATHVGTADVASLPFRVLVAGIAALPLAAFSGWAARTAHGANGEPEASASPDSLADPEGPLFTPGDEPELALFLLPDGRISVTLGVSALAGYPVVRLAPGEQYAGVAYDEWLAQLGRAGDPDELRALAPTPDRLPLPGAAGDAGGR